MSAKWKSGPSPKRRVLFLCVHNSVRSILAEHVVNQFSGDQYAAFSAGLSPGMVNPYTLRVLDEIGIDTRHARSKSVDEFRGQPFDLVVTVCSASEGQCPVWLGQGRRAHFPFDDPSQTTGTPDEVLARFRSLRDDMRDRLPLFLSLQFSSLA